jgi:hypothetical protein
MNSHSISLRPVSWKSFEAVSNPVQQHLFNFLDWRSLAQLACVNKRFKSLKENYCLQFRKVFFSLEKIATCNDFFDAAKTDKIHRTMDLFKRWTKQNDSMEPMAAIQEVSAQVASYTQEVSSPIRCLESLTEFREIPSGSESNIVSRFLEKGTFAIAELSLFMWNKTWRDFSGHYYSFVQSAKMSPQKNTLVLLSKRIADVTTEEILSEQRLSFRELEMYIQGNDSIAPNIDDFSLEFRPKSLKEIQAYWLVKMNYTWRQNGLRRFKKLEKMKPFTRAESGKVLCWASFFENEPFVRYFFSKKRIGNIAMHYRTEAIRDLCQKNHFSWILPAFKNLQGDGVGDVKMSLSIAITKSNIKAIKAIFAQLSFSCYRALCNSYGFVLYKAVETDSTEVILWIINKKKAFLTGEIFTRAIEISVKKAHPRYAPLLFVTVKKQEFHLEPLKDNCFENAIDNQYLPIADFILETAEQRDHLSLDSLKKGILMAVKRNNGCILFASFVVVKKRFPESLKDVFNAAFKEALREPGDLVQKMIDFALKNKITVDYQCVVELIKDIAEKDSHKALKIFSYLVSWKDDNLFAEALDEIYQFCESKYLPRFFHELLLHLKNRKCVVIPLTRSLEKAIVTFARKGHQDIARLGVIMFPSLKSLGVNLFTAASSTGEYKFAEELYRQVDVSMADIKEAMIQVKKSGYKRMLFFLDQCIEEKGLPDEFFIAPEINESSDEEDSDDLFKPGSGDNDVDELFESRIGERSSRRWSAMLKKPVRRQLSESDPDLSELKTQDLQADEM